MNMIFMKLEETWASSMDTNPKPSMNFINPINKKEKWRWIYYVFYDYVELANHIKENAQMCANILYPINTLRVVDFLCDLFLAKFNFI